MKDYVAKERKDQLYLVFLHLIYLYFEYKY